jgi:RHS repeat-associated protein
VTDTLVYDAWGVQLLHNGANETPFTAYGQWGYFRDAANRMDVRRRVLRVDLGRWVSRDPLGFGGGDWSLYGYAGDAPVIRVDPAGLQHMAPYPSGPQPGEFLAGFLCCAEQAREAIRTAQRFCKEFGLGSNDDGTICNAMQHCMWACLISQRCGGPGGLTGQEWALGCTDMHETDAPPYWRNCPGYRPVPDPYKPNPPTHKCMDLYNNRVGISCGASLDCYRCCLTNAKAGRVQIVVPSRPLPRRWRPPLTGCKTNPGGVTLPTIDWEPT